VHGARDKLSIPDLLHCTTLVQEAFILFTIETLRFKSPSVVKVNKLGSLAATLKCIRTDALALLKEISVILTERSERCSTAESRKAFVDACSQLTELEEIGCEFVSSVGRKLCESRKKVLEGVGKGITKISTTYSA